MEADVDSIKTQQYEQAVSHWKLEATNWHNRYLAMMEAYEKSYSENANLRTYHARWEEWFGQLDKQAERETALQAYNARLTSLLSEARETLQAAERGLRTCYNVNDYPGDGTSDQDAALQTVRATLAKLQEVTP